MTISSTEDWNYLLRAFIQSSKLYKWKFYFKIFKFNLITRPGPYCGGGSQERVNCEGTYVQKLTDACSFCGPLARIFLDYGNFIDLFPLHIELHTHENGTPFRFGYSVEEIDDKGILDISVMWPLQQCRIIGLDVPCPHHPSRLLDVIYGNQWRQPNKLCNGTTGKWEASWRVRIGCYGIWF